MKACTMNMNKLSMLNNPIYILNPSTLINFRINLTFIISQILICNQLNFILQMSGYCMSLRISFISHTDNKSSQTWLFMGLFRLHVSNYKSHKKEKIYFALLE